MKASEVRSMMYQLRALRHICDVDPNAEWIGWRGDRPLVRLGTGRFVTVGEDGQLRLTHEGLNRG